MSKTSNAETAKTDNLPFEEALKRLETIVDSMEIEDLSLEVLLAKFEEGVQLAKSCQARLTDAGVRISKLEKSSAGVISAKPLSPDLEEAEEQ